MFALELIKIISGSSDDCSCYKNIYWIKVHKQILMLASQLILFGIKISVHKYKQISIRLLINNTDLNRNWHEWWMM